MKTEALKQALDQLDLMRPLAARGVTRRRAGPRNGSSRFARKITFGIHATSGRSSGTCSTRESGPANRFGFSRCRTGPNWISGTTSCCRYSGRAALFRQGAPGCVPRTAPGSWWTTSGCRSSPAKAANASGPVSHARLLSLDRRHRVRRGDARGHRCRDETARVSERQGRLIDTDEAASMEKKKREGYF